MLNIRTCLVSESIKHAAISSTTTIETELIEAYRDQLFPEAHED
jgi:hypothetical protein